MPMKKCTNCGIDKPTSDFSRKNGRADKLYARCKACSNAIAIKYYGSNQTHRTRIKERGEALKQECYDFINRVKTFYGCSICGEKNPVCLDCHHIDSKEKETDIATYVIRKNKIGIIAELSKCAIICSNCHRKLHAGLIAPNYLVRVDVSQFDVDAFVGRRTRSDKLPLRPKQPDKRLSRPYMAKAAERKVVRPSYQTLLLEIDALGYCQTAKKYGVSDNTIRKWVRYEEKFI